MAKEIKRIEPIADVVPIWTSEFSDYPDDLLVGMHNGHVIRYQRVIEQPHPAFEKVMHLLDKIPVKGYFNPEALVPAKKRRRRL